MKYIYKIIIIVSLGVCLSLAVNCAKANVDYSKNFNLSLNNKNFLLVKTANSPAVYFIINNRRHKILNSEVFLDYGFSLDDVKNITDKQLEKYPPAKVVKTADDPKVYYINEALDKKKLIPNEAIFLAYGNMWEDVSVVSKKDLNSYFDINVIKRANDSKIYELKDGVKRVIADPQEFISKGYKWNEAVIVKDIELNYYPTKMAFKDEEAEIEYDESEKKQNDNLSSQIVSNDRFLSVKTIKQNKDILAPSGSISLMLKLKLTAGLEKPANVSSLKISRVKGFSLIEKIIIVDENNNALGSAEMLNKNYADVRLKPELYIAPGASKVININGSAKNDDHIFYEQLLVGSASDISTDANITGSFPLMGDRIKVIPGGKLIGKVEVGGIVISSGLRNVYIGETDSLITKFILSETTGNEDVYLKMLKITNTGSSSVKLANVDLVDQDNHVIATVKEPAGNIIVFDMMKSPYKITKGLSRTFSVRADIVDGPGGKIKFEIKQASDILTTGKEYLFDLMVSSKAGDSFPIGRGGNGAYANMVAINDVDVAVYKSDLSSVGGLVAGSGERSLGIFNIRANGSAINYKSVTLQAINEHGKVNLKGDLIIRDYKTKKAIGQIQASAASNGPAIVELDVYPKIETKQTFAFEVLANIDGNATISDTYQLKITGIGFQVFGSNFDHDIDCNVDGNILSVKKSNLVINSNGALKDAKVSTGKTNVLIGGFVLQAAVAEDLTVNSFNISEVVGYDDPITKKFYGAISYSEGYSNLKIRVNKKDYAVFPNPSGGQFISDKPFTIGAGKSVPIDVYVDTTPLVEGDKIKLAINGVNSYGKISGLEPSQTGNNSESLTTEFQQSKLTIKQNTEMGDTVINAGKNNQKIASFSFANAGVENIVIKNFTLAEAEGSDEISYNNGYSNLKTTGNHVVSKPIAGGNVFSNFTIKAGAVVVIDVYVSADASTANHNLVHFNLVLKDIQVASGIVVEGNNVVGQTITVVGN